MAHKPATDGSIEDAKKIAVLAAPARIESIGMLEALGGTATVAALAEQLGRPADGLYYHLRALVGAGLIAEDAGAGDGRRYRTTSARGQRLRLRYKPGATANAKAVGRVAAGVSRLAQRDFVRALSQGGTVVEGPSRELWAARLRGWVGTAQLAEVNRLLRRLTELFDRSRPTAAGKLIALQWVLAPIEVKPARRGVADKSATQRRSR
jgi:DNA-binding transcriptional ArsR family regulator